MEWQGFHRPDGSVGTRNHVVIVPGGHEALDGPIADVNPIPANRVGGLTTLERKSLGAVRKAGTAPLSDVLAYAERPQGPGLYFVDPPF